MNYHVPEVENFEPKSRMLTKLMDQLSSGYDINYVDVNFLGEHLGLNSLEMDSLIYYLNRGEIIKADLDKRHIKLTEYGRMIYCSKENIPAMPILG